MFGRNRWLWSHLVLDFCFLGVFLITSHETESIIRLFKFSISSSHQFWEVLFLGIYPFLLGRPVCWPTIFHDFLIILCSSLWFRWFFPLDFLKSLTRGLSILLIKESAPGFTDLWFFKLLFISTVVLIYFYFVLSLAPLGRRLGWLGFFLLLQVGLYCYKPLSSNHFCCIPKILNHSLCFVSMYFLFPPISWLTHCLLACYLTSKYLCSFKILSYSWCLVDSMVIGKDA